MSETKTPVSPFDLAGNYDDDVMEKFVAVAQEHTTESVLAASLATLCGSVVFLVRSAGQGKEAAARAAAGIGADLPAMVSKMWDELEAEEEI